MTARAPGSSRWGWQDTSGLAIVNFISAKSPRALRSRMWRSVSSYAVGGAAPATSRPSSRASRSSSAAVMWKIVPVKAIRIHEDGGPDVLRYEEAPDPVPGTGQVLIDLRAASLNHLDIWIRKGLPSVAKPRILGADGAGVVVSGNGFAPGERVVINPGLDHGGGRITVVGEHTHGTHADPIAVPKEQVYRRPDTLGFAASAAFPPPV